MGVCIFFGFIAIATGLLIYNGVYYHKKSQEPREEKEKTLVKQVNEIVGTIGLLIYFSYERLEYCMSGYGYPYKDSDAMLDMDYTDDNGLFLLDLERGKRNLLISLKQLAEQSPEEFRSGHLHYVTHSEFSPDGRYLSFLHRWIRREGTNLKRWTRMMVYDRNTMKMVELPTQLSGSHYVWNHKNQLLGSFIIDGKSVHLLFDMNDFEHYNIICSSKLNQDGHQSFVGNDMFITDTYPDKRRMAKLYLVDIQKSEVRIIADTFSPKEFQSNAKVGHVACDLHPTVSASGNYVCFDCPRTGKRGLYIMKLSNE